MRVSLNDINNVIDIQETMCTHLLHFSKHIIGCPIANPLVNYPPKGSMKNKKKTPKFHIPTKTFISHILKSLKKVKHDIENAFNQKGIRMYSP